MKLAIAGFITIDTLVFGRLSIESLGGPPSYISGIVSRLGVKPYSATMVGEDFKKAYLDKLNRYNLRLGQENFSKSKPTTRFKINVRGSSRDLYLLSRCEDIPSSMIEDLSTEALIVNPIARELDIDSLPRLLNDFYITYLDPQGILRDFKPDGYTILRGLKDLKLLKHFDYVKANLEEAEALFGSRDERVILKKVKRLGIKCALLPLGKRGVYLYHGGRAFHIKVPEINLKDNTGAGDIFAGVFTALIVKGEDLLWSATLATVTASLSLNYRGIDKVEKVNIDTRLADEIYQDIREYSI